MTDTIEKLTCAEGREHWRVFCALDVGASVRRALSERIERLRKDVPRSDASWSRLENLHLTLKFLGQLETSRLAKLYSAADEAVANFSPFQVSIEETGVFRQRGKPRVLWIGVKDYSGMLAHLHARLEEACARVGFPREDRPFRPHLTLARLRKPKGAQSLAEAHQRLQFEASVIEINEVLVLRSELNPRGSKYTVISRHPLGGRSEKPS